MELSALDIKGLNLLMQKVYLPLMEYLARKANHRDWLDTLNDFGELIVQFDLLINEEELLKMGNPLKKGLSPTKPVQTSFPTLREEYLFWQKQIMELSLQQQWMLQNWGEVTTEINASLRQVHYTMKLFQLVRDPVEVFTERKTLIRVDVYVKSLASSLKAVLLQPSSKSGIHSKFADLVSSNSNTLAKWILHSLTPKDLMQAEVDHVIRVLKLWEDEWAESKLGVVSKLTGQEFSDMFLCTRTVLDSVQTVQSIIKETRALREMCEQIDDYFSRQRLLAMIRDDLEKRVENLDKKLFLVEYRADFQAFVAAHQLAHENTVKEIKATLKFVLDEHTSFEGLKLLRKVIDKSQSLAGTHSGALDQFLAHHQRDHLNRLSTEIRLIRKGFDVTDYINEKDAGNVDMAQKLFERRLLYHRVKTALVTIFPRPKDWDETSASVKIKDQYVELAKYLRTTEDKLHQKWFTTVQRRASKAMSKPILKKTPKGFVTTLQDTLMTIWDETRLFLQTRFQVPHVCHILMMQKPDLIHHNRTIIAVLERLASVVEKLTPYEFVVLNSCYSSVENGLNLGTAHVTWPSVCLGSYIQELLESVERFQAMAEDVGLISIVLERRIAQIMDHHLLSEEYDKSNSNKTHLSAEEFFNKLRRSGEEFFADILAIVSGLPPILLQVESIVCNSQTGSAPELQNYYDYWREKIYNAVLKSVQARFDELSNLLENGPAQFVIELFLRDGQVVVEPALESIELDMYNVVHHWIKCSSVVPVWLEGSCNIHPVDQRSLYDRLSQEPLLKATVDRDQQHCKHLVSKLRTIIDGWTDCTTLWSMNKTEACVQLREMDPTLSQYDEQLQYYRNYWSDRIGVIEEQVTTSCVVLEMKRLKEAALEHIKEWIGQLGATWLAGTVAKLAKVEDLAERRKQSRDGSLDIDIELLIMEVQESWHRLGHYNIKVPEDTRMKLHAIKLKMKTK